ncbi:MAG: nicotinate phosphoribosyltransferase [Verrucomicrobia bacterium]|nr:nicotinate phosphoribosyltransferase [Verrucomicrobiota bacterium]MBS0636955.1 nicotinate phosphoribosyltransferase [Verrucomicrobiota bacterium]
MKISALLTDFYQLTMAQGYWKEGIDNRKASFHLFYRTAPFGGDCAVACGLELVVDFIKNFSFEDSDIDYLASLNIFEKPFLEMLRGLKLTVDVDAVEEGTLVYPYEPLVRVEGPILQCQLLESVLLNVVNFSTLIATKAARVSEAAEGDPVMEFGLRRAQGIDGALTASRAAFIGGCSSTSNVLAGKTFGIPVQGTHAHSWVMAFDDEEEAFRAYVKVYPKGGVLLVDTYDTIEGVKKAIKVGNFSAIRLDSGDLAELSKEARKLLDAAGLEHVKIVASNELDEDAIRELKKKGAKISLWGVGTNLVTGKGAGALNGVYKLSAIQNSSGEWKSRMKFGKGSNPGRLQVRRLADRDIMYDIDLGVDVPGVDLLVPIFREGKLVYTLPKLLEIKKKVKKLAGRAVEMEERLLAVKQKLQHG